MERDERARRHVALAARLERASDDELVALVASGVEGVFVKRAPATAHELAPACRGATANIFGLPTYYQYRIGSYGFGVWRELEVHRLANDWVLSGRCAGFPLLHHARVLPVDSGAADDRADLRVWGDDRAIAQRVAAVAAATSSVVMFLERAPMTLGAQLRRDLPTIADPAAHVIALERQLRELLAFVHGQGVLHLDAHLENVLTDGAQLYLADFGLALSTGFELAADERRFLDAHRSFDLCTAINGLVHALVRAYDARGDWRQTLREVVAGTHAAVDAAPAGVRAYLVERAPLAWAVGDFYDRLLADLDAPYPAAAFEALLEDLGA